MARWERLIVALVLVVAAILRLAALGDVPPGPCYDELQDARLSERVLAGDWAIYYSENFGQEPLYPALAALSVRLLGWSVVALRLPGALLGIVTVLALYLVARRLFLSRPWGKGGGGRYVPLFAAAFQAISFWPLVETRMALETALLPPMAALAVLFLARGLGERDNVRQDSGTIGHWRSTLPFALAGLFVGGHLYAYTPGRVMPFLVPLLLVYLLLFDRSTLRRHWVGLLSLLVVTMLVILPLLLFLRAHPESEQRLDQLSGPLDALRRGKFAPALQTVVGTLGMFSLQGEPQWLYNIPDRPLFDPFTSAFFFIGLALCLLRLRNWRYGLSLLWLLVGLAPAFVSPPAGSYTHTLIAQPAVYLVLGLGLAEVTSQLKQQRAWIGPTVAALVLIINAVLSWQAYFVTWADASQVEELYQGGITAVARDLDAQEPPGPVAVGAPYVNYWHPWNAVGFELALERDDLDVRWFNPGGGWVWPGGAGATTFYFPEDPLGHQSFAPELKALFAADAVPLSSAGEGFAAFRVDRPAALNERLARLPGVTLSWPPELVHLPAPELPLVFGDRFALLGVEYLANAVAPGEELRFITYWEVQAENPAPVIAFVHLTSDGQDIWGQQDWLDVRPNGLMPDDRFAQVHRLPAKPDTPPALYYVQLGLYAPDSLVRLPVNVAGEPAADRVWVGEVQVENPR